MSETIKLNSQQREQIKEWLNEKGFIRCKACQMNNVAPPSVIISFVETDASEPNLSIVPVYCSFCANTLLLNAAIVGIL